MDAGSWVFSSFVDYYDARTDAVGRHAEQLRSSTPEDARDALDTVSRVVTGYARDLTDDQLVGCTVSMVDDLYKTASWIDMWSRETTAYVHAVFGNFLSVAGERGKQVRYIVDNSFDEGSQRALTAYPAAFQAAGVVYVCPHQIAFTLAQKSGLSVGENPGPADLASLLAEARNVASRAASAVVERGRHLAYLEADFEPGSMDHVRSLPTQPGTITILREEAPTAGSRVMVLTT